MSLRASPKLTSASIGPMEASRGRRFVAEVVSLSSLPPFTQFLGIDWASEAHELCLLSLPGETRSSLSIPHAADGFASLLAWLAEQAPVA